MRSVVACSLALLGLAALGAWAQTIKIPDFREPPVVVAPKPGMPCDECGSIRSIREIVLQRSAPALRGFQRDPETLGTPHLVGGVIALPLGGGGSDQPFIGGVGTPEMKERFDETSYVITVRMDNGGFSNVQRRDGARFQVGDRVRLSEGRMELLAN